ncbi:Uncharacterised protein [Kluyvera cryocrescens]|uniref:Uncharacterized protein n=1 Tax=Kluyvera cryocrescens TaxID=580 RepID=A0A485CVY3_KLUCR|nr:Uncharacterised protein [Kluyvera cryocrescens]
MQQTEEAPGQEAAANANVAIGHELHKAHQHPSKEDFRHSPGFERKQNTREKCFKPVGHSDLINQQQNGDQAKRWHQLYKQQEKGAKGWHSLQKT